jgi:uncharacterized protein with PIN domain
MFNFLKKLSRKKKKGLCPKCGGKLIKPKADVIRTYGKPVMVCSKCKKLVEV